MVKIGFSDSSQVINEVVSELKNNTNHTSIIFKGLSLAIEALKNKEIDCLVGGHDISTGDYLKEIFKVIKPTKRVYSYSVLSKDGKSYYFSDTAVNLNLSKEQLTDLEESLNRELKPYVNYFELTRISYKTDNETMQVDAALDPLIASKKGILNSSKKNVFLFPNIESANIAYKLIQRLGCYSHVGPIILNLGYPVSDLSRGADKIEIYETALYLADLSLKKLGKF